MAVAEAVRVEERQATVDWRRCIVVHAAMRYQGPRFAVQHLADNLSRYMPVLYVDPPVSALGAVRYPELRSSMSGPRLAMLTPRMAHLRPVLPPGKERVGMTAISSWLLRRRVAAALRTLSATPYATVVQDPVRPLLRGLHDQRRVFLVTDDYPMLADIVGVSEARLRRGEAALASHADVIVVVSTVLAEKFRSMGYAPLLVPNGCDASLFAGVDAAPVAVDVDLRPPIVGFVGFLSDRADFTLLDAIARRGHSLLLVAPRIGRFDMSGIRDLLARPNVRWVGGKPHGALPSYLRCIDVGIVPYPDTQLNRASFPLKTLEYLAAGRRVVTTDLPAVRWLDTELVRIAPFDPTGFADAVEASLAEPDDEARRARRRAFAARHGWPQRADLVADALELQGAVT
jgi:glycosyltransferase involved in cell wall biosynthesis